MAAQLTPVTARDQLVHVLAEDLIGRIGEPTRHPRWHGSAPVAGTPMIRRTPARKHWQELLGRALAKVAAIRAMGAASGQGSDAAGFTRDGGHFGQPGA